MAVTIPFPRCQGHPRLNARVVAVIAAAVLFTLVFASLNSASCYVTPNKPWLSRAGLECERKWSEPDYALLTAPPPHTFSCNVTAERDASPLIFIGVFSLAFGGRRRRDHYRKTVMQEYPEEYMTVRFILARPRLDNYPPILRDLAAAYAQRSIDEEIRQYGDVVVLDTVDNMDDGKTHTFFKYMAATYGSQTRGRPQFVLKADDDTVFAVPNLIANFRALDCNKNVYWGTTSGADWEGYMRGMAYGLSWPLVAWIGSVELTSAHESGFEDARTGQWLESLDPLTDPVQHVDMHWAMGDWNQVNVTVDTVALHWLKLDRWFTEQHARIRTAWVDANRTYEVDNGVPLADSLAHGAQEPGIRRTGVARFCIRWNIAWACRIIGLERPWFTPEYKAKIKGLES